MIVTLFKQTKITVIMAFCVQYIKNTNVALIFDGKAKWCKGWPL